MRDKARGVGKTKKALKNQRFLWFLVACDRLLNWCRGEDLNLHGVTPTST